MQESSNVKYFKFLFQFNEDSISLIKFWFYLRLIEIGQYLFIEVIPIQSENKSTNGEKIWFY